MSKFKIGDRVKLITASKHEDEYINWAEESGIELGDESEVIDVWPRGDYIKVSGSIYSHISDKFELA